MLSKVVELIFTYFQNNFQKYIFKRFSTRYYLTLLPENQNANKVLINIYIYKPGTHQEQVFPIYWDPFHKTRTMNL